MSSVLFDEPLTLEEEAELYGHLVDHPVTFSREVLGADPWSTCEDIMRAIAEPRARVAVKACHASGKTWTAAQIVLWWVATGGKAVTTAPTWTQVEELLWGEIHKAYHGARYPIGGTLNETELELFKGEVLAKGLSTDKGVRFQGWHGDRVLVVMDEAPGVRPDIWEAIEGIRAGGDVRVLALGNPTIASGPFHDAFTAQRSGWTTFSIDAFDTPNLQGVTLEQLRDLPEAELDEAERPYLVTRRWVLEKWNEWGEGHPLWDSRVKGRFPQQAEDSLYSLAWVEAARREASDPGGPVVAGVDVAGPGEDESAVKVRCGSVLLAEHSCHEADARGTVIRWLQPWRSRLQAVYVDEVGIGYHMMTHLRDQGLPVFGVNAGEAPRDKERFINRKAEVAWSLRERLEAGDVAGLVDEATIGQLAGIRWRANARGQVVIESKDEARRRGVKSPDRAEALILAYIQSGPRLSAIAMSPRLEAASAWRRRGHRRDRR